MKKSANGRIAAPTVTASGPRLPSSIVTFSAGWCSAAGNADADTEEPLGVEACGGEHLGDSGADVVDDDLDLVALLLQRALGPGEFGEGQVEQLDPHPGLADIDADHVAAARCHPQQGARAAAGGVDAARLLDQAVTDQVGDDI